MSAAEKPRLTLETAVASCSTAPHCFVEADDDAGEEEETGVGEGGRADAEDVDGVRPWLEARGHHSLSEASLSASLLLSWAPESLSLPSDRLPAAAILHTETPRADPPATASSSARLGQQAAPFSSTDPEESLLSCF